MPEGGPYLLGGGHSPEAERRTRDEKVTKRSEGRGLGGGRSGDLTAKMAEQLEINPDVSLTEGSERRGQLFDGRREATSGRGEKSEMLSHSRSRWSECIYSGDELIG